MTREDILKLLSGLNEISSIEDAEKILSTLEEAKILFIFKPKCEFCEKSCGSDWCPAKFEMHSDGIKEK